PFTPLWIGMQTVPFPEVAWLEAEIPSAGALAQPARRVPRNREPIVVFMVVPFEGPSSTARATEPGEPTMAPNRHVRAGEILEADGAAHPNRLEVAQPRAQCWATRHAWRPRGAVGSRKGGRRSIVRNAYTIQFEQDRFSFFCPSLR